MLGFVVHARGKNQMSHSGGKTVSRALWGAFLGCLLCLAAAPALAAVMPEGYRLEPVVRGADLAQPQAMAIAPDGRVFIAEKAGKVRIVKNGELLTQPFVDVAVSTTGEEGLLGIALDPAFASNGYVYLYLTNLSPYTNRIVRYTAAGDTGSSPLVVLDNIGAPATTEPGGALVFGADDKLYATVGVMDADADAQDLGSLAGKILRMEADGSAPADNPNAGQPYPYSLIYATGTRNGTGLAANLPAGMLYATDDYDGDAGCDETNQVASGDDFGWNVESCSGSTYKGPLNSITPGVGVSGIVAYTGTAYPDFADDLFISGNGSGSIIRDELGPTHDTLAASHEFYTPEGECPTALTDVAQGHEGFLYVLSNDGTAGRFGLYKVVPDPWGLGGNDGVPREVSAGHTQLVIGKDGLGGLDFWWEDTKRDAWVCSPGHCPTGVAGGKYTIWSGELATPFSLNHNPWVTTSGTEVDDARIHHNEAVAPEGDKYFLISSWGANREGSLGSSRAGSTPTEADRCNAIGRDPNTDDMCMSGFPGTGLYPDQDNNLWSLEDFRGKAVQFSFADYG